MSRAETLKRLWLAVSHSRPDAASIGPRRMAAQFLRCAGHLETFRDWFGNPANPALQEALASRPSLATCVVHPYLNVDWPAGRKLQAVSQHYGLLSWRLGFLRFAPPTSIALAEVAESIQIRLDKPIQFEHEGEITINLFRGDVRLYSLVFTLGQIDSRRVAYAGALQGVSGADSLEIYRTLTHRMDGLRPRDLLVTAFRLLCCSMGVARILAISDLKRVCSSTYFQSSAQVFSSYDSAWIDSGGVAGEGGFFELNPTTVHRSAETIPSRKRAQYRRRYAMIDAMSQQIDHSVRHARGQHQGIAMWGNARTPDRTGLKVTP